MSLFNKIQSDNILDDVFSNSAAFAAAPVPSPSMPIATATGSKVTITPEVNADGTLKRKAGKKERPAKPSKVEKSTSESKTRKSSSTEKVAASSKSVEESTVNHETTESSPPKTVEVVETTGNSPMEQDEAPTDETSEQKPNQRKNRRQNKKTKYVPEGETELDRDRRTVFVGNVAVDVLKSNSLQSQFKAHLLTFVPDASIESVRFRSIAFAAPTTQQDDPAAPITEAEKEEETRRVEREKERAKTWREEQDEEDAGRANKRRRLGEDRDAEDGTGKDGKVFFKPGEKRRVAFFKGDFHKDVASANAYVVFAHPAPDRSKNVKPLMDPFEAASQLIAQGNNSLFQSLHLRLDSVRPTLDSIAKAAATEGKSTLPARREIWTAGRDVKNSLFVGNLDAAAKEEDLRLFFEALVEKERGPEPKGGQYVLDVRIIRDKETQMAKGFGYIAFNERESVDEILAMPSNKLRHAKRNLRVQPCKTLPSALGGREIKPAPTMVKGKNGKPVPAASNKPGVKAVKRPITPKVILPQVAGDPKLGEKISTLSKEDRKAFKATDATRLARRAAKKQSAKLKDSLANRRDKVKLDVKGTSKKLAGNKDKAKAKKSRVRSEHAAKKVKGKRD